MTCSELWAESAAPSDRRRRAPCEAPSGSESVAPSQGRERRSPQLARRLLQAARIRPIRPVACDPMAFDGVLDEAGEEDWDEAVPVRRLGELDDG